MRRLVGHITWCALLRREVLALLSACYHFMEAGPEPQRVWDSALKELNWIRSLLPLLQRDTRRPWCPTVYATDAAGCSSTDARVDDFGGYGVCVAHRAIEETRRLGRCSEKWRYLVDDLVAARRAALTEEGDRLEHELGMGYTSRAPGVLPRSDVATLRFGAGAGGERPASHFAVVARDFDGSMQGW